MTQVERVDVGDVRAVAAMAADAFIDSELWSTLVPDATQRRAALEAIFFPLILDAVRRHPH